MSLALVAKRPGWTRDGQVGGAFHKVTERRQGNDVSSNEHVTGPLQHPSSSGFTCTLAARQLVPPTPAITFRAGTC